MKKKYWHILIILFAWGFAIKFYSIFQGVIESAFSAKQLLDDKISYALSQWVSNGAISTIINCVFVVILMVIVLKKEKKNEE